MGPGMEPLAAKTNPDSPEPTTAPLVTDLPVLQEPPMEPSPSAVAAVPQEPALHSPVPLRVNPSLPAAETPPQPKAPPTPASRRGQPLGAIITAAIIGLALAGLAVFAYLKTQNISQAPANIPAPAAANAASPATAQDVDQTSKALDQSLGSVDDSQAFTENELTDSTLGL